MRGIIRFAPELHERVWGGRRLAAAFGKELPEGAVIGESWELVDRPTGSSVIVAPGELAGATLGELWDERREELFGATALTWGEDFPLLVKLLDCTQALSVQVHPPPEVAEELGGEPKTETWVIAAAEPGAHLLVGFRSGVTREAFGAALEAGEDVSEMLQRLATAPGDVMHLPSGRVHAIGAGNLVVEVQQSSDTTYRVFDFDRPGLDGKPRELHVPESLASIDFTDVEPALAEPDGEVLVRCPFYVLERWELDGTPRRATEEGACAILAGLSGAPTLAGEALPPGAFALVPASSVDAEAAGTGTVLRIALPPAPTG